jgi:hypothetical protein
VVRPLKDLAYEKPLDAKLFDAEAGLNPED